MKRLLLLLVSGCWLAVTGGFAAELTFNFSTNQPGQLPAGFKTFVAGEGPPGDWQVRLASVPSLLAPLTDRAAANGQIPVLAQMSRDRTDDRYPVAYFDGDRYGDFTLKTRFRIVDGVTEQLSGVVFRMQDETNFCVVRASALGNNIRFYKFVNGQRTLPVGNDLPIHRGQWYDLTVKAEGNKFDVLLDGEPVIPTLTDNSFPAGKVGFFTKSDTVSEFAEMRLTYKPLVSFAESLLQRVVEQQPRLLNVRIYGKTSSRPELHVLASKNPDEVGTAATETELGVLSGNEIFYGKVDREILVTTPLRDRNGDAVGVVKFFLKPFAGQTEDNAVARIRPTVRWMEAQLAASEGLSD